MTNQINNISYIFENFPSPGEILKVTDNIFWVRMPLPFALDHINLWLVKSYDNKWTLIDTGFGDHCTKEIWKKIFRSKLGIRLSKIIITHYHPDHFGNAGWLSRKFNLDVHMTMKEFNKSNALYSNKSEMYGKNTDYLFKKHGLIGLPEQIIKKKTTSYKANVHKPPQSYTRLEEKSVVKIGDSSWEILIGLGHSPEHACLFSKTDNILISGDMLLPKISTNISVSATNPEGDPLKNFLDSIKKFLKLPNDVLVLPSHGIPFRGAHFRVSSLQKHHEDRLKEVKESCKKKPINAFELLPILFKRKLDNHQIFFAMGESIAHLNYLWHKKILNRHDCNGSYKFTPNT